MILGALWFSDEKPTMTTFLRPLMDAFNDLYKNGKTYACCTCMIVINNYL